MMTPKDYPELEAFVAEAIEANEYKRVEIAAANLLNAFNVLGLHVTPDEPTEKMIEAMAKEDGFSFSRSKVPTVYRAALKANPLRKERAMSDNMDFEAWRCKHDETKFCPDEGCPKWYGCARDKGWRRPDPTPDAIIRGRNP